MKEKFDLEQIDDAFEYAREVAESVQVQLSKFVGRAVVPTKDKELLILYRSLKSHFTIGQIWERLNDKERKILSIQLTPVEIITLKKEGHKILGGK